ncbi:unnamed protein product [Spirodela intermedia]|uniref:Uncharacterized protein n=1 Tax=Spirodela intermedia TaxID=51605 RepID=A0A7I8L9H5_SPIIN|nr:unnamed protein product [Spirodela intermedia]
MQEEEDNEDGHNVVGEDQRLLGDYELRVNEAPEGVNVGPGSGSENPARQDEAHKAQLQHRQQKQSVLPPPSPPVPVVGWERFLPVRSLKVLLVENDDSTRHVVNALLRNCSYEVTAVANGLEAWKILEDLSNRIDIVLTEVVMPFLSGIGLLDKIMSHKTLKNIPVIMMSSHDSMGIVFKCLSKGAVDFLVKPIRKNELKTLWQHVWRRCHSSSGSGSESGVQTQKSVKSKRVDSDDNNGSNDEDDDASFDYNDKDGSDNGSGTQSSWTKRAPDSPQATTPWDQLAETPDSTCAHVIHQKPDYVPPCSECSEEKDHRDDDLLEKNSEKNFHQSDGIFGTLDGSNAVGELTIQGADLVGIFAESTVATMSVQASNSLNRVTEENDKIIANESPSFELSLKRLRSIAGDGIGCSDDRYVLRRSDFSAFSRYNTSTASTQKATRHGGNSSARCNVGSDVVKRGSDCNMKSKTAAIRISQGCNSGTKVDEVGPTNNFISKSKILNENESSSLSVNPIQQRTDAAQNELQEKNDNKGSSTIMERPRGTRQIQVKHHHHQHHYDSQHDHVARHQLELPSEQVAAVPPCGSSNMFNGPTETNVGNYSINVSISGSQHGSNAQNGSSTMNPERTNMESENVLIGKKEAGGCNGSGSGSGSGMDENRFAQRVAALTKFRQKRNQRCFQKKVRYQSRKKLAEQRPRLHGQFAKQTAHDHADPEAGD